MGLDLVLTHKKNGEDDYSLNWLRNPFGLCNWVEDNTDLKLKKDLYYVCNRWAYDNAKNLNRKLFQEVVLAYQEPINNLERGYFWFDLPSYIAFIQPNIHSLPMRTSTLGGQPRIDAAIYNRNGDKYGIPMEYFGASCFHMGGRHTLKHYKEWYGRLVEFAEVMQNRDYRFHCSN